MANHSITKTKGEFERVWEDITKFHVNTNMKKKIMPGDIISFEEYVVERDLYTGREIIVEVTRVDNSERAKQIVFFEVIS